MMATAHRATGTVIHIRTITTPATPTPAITKARWNPDQSQGYYDSSVYQAEAYYDPNGDSDQSQSNYSIVVTAQERLARQGYYHGETDGAQSSEMQKAVKRYQITNGLRPTGYLDSETLGVMGLRKGASY